MDTATNGTLMADAIEVSNTPSFGHTGNFISSIVAGVNAWQIVVTILAILIAYDQCKHSCPRNTAQTTNCE
jgi:hypothetical protein